MGRAVCTFDVRHPSLVSGASGRNPGRPLDASGGHRRVSRWPTDVFLLAAIVNVAPVGRPRGATQSSVTCAEFAPRTILNRLLDSRPGRRTGSRHGAKSRRSEVKKKRVAGQLLVSVESPFRSRRDPSTYDSTRNASFPAADPRDSSPVLHPRAPKTRRRPWWRRPLGSPP